MSIPVFVQVNKAVNQMMEMILSNKTERFFLLLAAMQSGKTQFIIEMYLRFKQAFPRSMGLYIVGHNHREFIDQNFIRLEHLVPQDCYCLTLSERRQSKIKGRSLRSYINDPIIIFFDENHFADGVEQTIDRFLKINKLYPSKKVYLVGVSATPFSSIKSAEGTTVMYDSALMPTYKSVTAMLSRGDLREATPLLKDDNGKMSVIESSSAFAALKDIIENKNHGYVILRITQKSHAEFLEKRLKKLFSKKVHVRHWNQKNQIASPSDYFGNYRKDIVTVVIVQQKARMGNTIPTRFVHMVYDHAPSASVATVVQGLLGRCCGHGKIDDYVTVFTHLHHAKAYSLFELGKFDEFYSYMTSNNLKASQRSTVESSSAPQIVTELIAAETSKRMLVRQLVTKHLTGKFGEDDQFKNMVVRNLSHNKFEGEWYKSIIDKPLDEASNKKLMRDNNKVSVFVDDRTLPYRVFITFRLGEYLPKIELAPKPSSLFSLI